MTNGLGAGFFALTLLAVLAGLALLVVLVTVAVYAFDRRTGRVPALLTYLVVVVGAVALGVTGFGILVLYDVAPPVAGLLALTALVPILVVGGYLDRTTELGRVDVVATTVMAWGPTFLVGLVVVFGVASGINAVFDLAPAESLQAGIPWIASAVGGLAIVLGMLPVSDRLGGVVHSATATREVG